MAGIQEQARRRQANLLGERLEDPSKCRRNGLTASEKREWAIVRKAERRGFGLVDGLRFETEEESADYLRRREEEDAAHRPDRKGQAMKKRTGFQEKAQFREREADYEKQREMVAAMSREKAQSLLNLLRRKYGGSKWPADVCRLNRLLTQKAITMEAA